MRLDILRMRGSCVEAEHPIYVSICNSSGKQIADIGGGSVTTFRSAAKPFQLIGSSSQLGAATLTSLTTEDWALGTASHNGEATHIDGLRGLLNRLRVDEGELRCGAAMPTHGPSRRALVAAAQTPAPLYHPCAGKHAFMAAANRAAGGKEDYLATDAPVQRTILGVLESFSGRTSPDLVIDGCGTPCFVLSLHDMATTWARLAATALPRSSASDDGDWICPPAHESHVGRVVASATNHPHLISGTDCLDMLVQSGASETVISKIGADGLLCMAFVDRVLGLALKVCSGVDRVRPAALLAVLDKAFGDTMGLDVLLGPRLRLHNSRGDAVGGYVARWS